MVEKYCSSCIHMLSGECMLKDNKKSLCKSTSLGLWFPNVKDREKIEDITGTLKDSVHISDLELPPHHMKKKIIKELELTLEPNGHYRSE